MEKIALGEAFGKLKGPDDKEVPVGDITVEKVVVPEQSYEQMPSTMIGLGSTRWLGLSIGTVSLGSMYVPEGVDE